MQEFYYPQPKFRPRIWPRQAPKRTIPSYIGEPGQVANWLFYNGAGGKLYDFSGEENHGEIKDASWKDGRYGWGLEFDPSNLEYVDLGTGLNSIFDGGGSITVLAWVYADAFSTDDFQGIVTESYDPSANNVVFELCYDDTISAWKAGFYDGSWHDVTGGTPSTGVWTHLAATYDGSTLILYESGMQVDSLDDTAGLPAGDEAWTIGRRHDSFDTAICYWDGLIKFVSIYELTFSSDEVSEHYESTRGIFGV